MRPSTKGLVSAIFLSCMFSSVWSDGSDMPYTLRKKFGYMGEPGPFRQRMQKNQLIKDRETAGVRPNPHRAGLADQTGSIQIKPHEQQIADERFFLVGRRRPFKRPRPQSHYGAPPKKRPTYKKPSHKKPHYKPAPPSYSAPAPSYSPESDTYGSPQYEPEEYQPATTSSPSYEAPEPSYESPEPSYEAPGPSYEAPAPSYEAPAPSYEAPAPSYEAPAPSYEAPAPSYEAPEPSYNPPEPSYAAPAPSYSPPSYEEPSYGGGSQGFADFSNFPKPDFPDFSFNFDDSFGFDFKKINAAASNLDNFGDSYKPQSGYSEPPSSYNSPESTTSYEAPSPSYELPTYNSPAVAYSAPAPEPSYEPSPPVASYSPPAVSYSPPAVSYSYNPPAPEPSYAAPVESYNPPAPEPSYNVPEPQYTPPATEPSYNVPAIAYSAPAEVPPPKAYSPPEVSSYRPPIAPVSIPDELPSIVPYNPPSTSYQTSTEKETWPVGPSNFQIPEFGSYFNPESFDEDFSQQAKTERTDLSNSEPQPSSPDITFYESAEPEVEKATPGPIENIYTPSPVYYKPLPDETSNVKRSFKKKSDNIEPQGNVPSLKRISERIQSQKKPFGPQDSFGSAHDSSTHHSKHSESFSTLKEKSDEPGLSPNPPSSFSKFPENFGPISDFSSNTEKFEKSPNFPGSQKFADNFGESRPKERVGTSEAHRPNFMKGFEERNSDFGNFGSDMWEMFDQEWGQKVTG